MTLCMDDNMLLIIASEYVYPFQLMLEWSETILNGFIFSKLYIEIYKNYVLET